MTSVSCAAKLPRSLASRRPTGQGFAGICRFSTRSPYLFGAVYHTVRELIKKAKERERQLQEMDALDAWADCDDEYGGEHVGNRAG